MQHFRDQTATNQAILDVAGMIGVSREEIGNNMNILMKAEPNNALHAFYIIFMYVYVGFIAAAR